jgi:transcriptional regulator with XRE-family HTH domain
MPALTRPMRRRPNQARSGRPLDEYPRIIGETLQARRLELGLTQAQVADAIGELGTSAVSNWEVGRIGVPPERHGALADILEMPHEAFAKLLLRYGNPWTYAMIFDPKNVDTKLQKEIAPVRRGRRGKAASRRA